MRALISLVIGALSMAAPPWPGPGGWRRPDHRVRPRLERRRAARRRCDGDPDRHRHRAQRGHRRRRRVRLSEPAGRARTSSRPTCRGSAPSCRTASSCRSTPTRCSTSRMQIGAVSEQLTVTANASMVETRSTGIGQVIDNQRVVELPLNGRQATELIFLSGLATSAPAADLNTNKNYPTVTISVAGGQANGMTYIMDGGTHNDPFNNLNLPTPFPDALQEFKVETSALPARYGHHASSAVNLVTKSGTNDLSRHGVHLPPQLPLQRPQRPGHQHRQPRAQPVRRCPRRTADPQQGVLLRRLPGPAREPDAADRHPLGADAGDAGRRLHRLGLARVQRRPARSALRAPFVDNRDRGRRSSMRWRSTIARYLPASTDPCGRVQFGIPNDSTEHQALGRVDYTLNQRAQPVCPLPVRPLREPGELRRPERAHAEPHRPDQRRQLGRHGPQVAAHQQPGQLVDRHLQQDAERPPAARVLHRHRPRQQHRQPVSRLFRRQRHRQRVHRRRRRHQPRLLRLDRLPDRRRRRSGARQPPDLGRRQLDPHQDRDLQQPPDQRPVHLQRPVHRAWRWPTSWSAR